MWIKSIARENIINFEFNLYTFIRNINIEYIPMHIHIEMAVIIIVYFYFDNLNVPT